MPLLDRASQFAEIALGHVTREYPNKLDHVLGGDADLRAPRTLHPIFYGSFDWHSCVHGYWLLARLLRRHPDMPQAERINALFESAFTHDNVATECAYLARPLTGTFERPYGWAWLLALAAELALHKTASARRWSDALQPLAVAFAQRFLTFLPKLAYPVRSGVHSNSAFAISLALDYAGTVGDNALAEALSQSARRWFSDDADCQAWEPSGEDFLSPSLTEAECMRRSALARRIRRMVSRIFPTSGTRRAASAATAGERNGSQRRQDCASRRVEPHPGLVLEQPCRRICRGRCAVPGHARCSAATSGSLFATCIRRLHGRTLARHVCLAGAGSRGFGLSYGRRSRCAIRRLWRRRFGRPPGTDGAPGEASKARDFVPGPTHARCPVRAKLRLTLLELAAPRSQRPTQAPQASPHGLRRERFDLVHDPHFARLGERILVLAKILLGQ